MEFGVGHGHSVNYISKIFEDQIVYGFDSFEGLPEPWNGPDTYEYNVPAIDINSLKLNSNIEIRQGFFKDSIPIWIAEINPEKIKFMHIDSNLYSSAITTLSLLDKFIVPGTVICLDEFFFWDEPHKWPLWYKEEFRALKEWVTLYDRSFEILFYGNRNELSIQIN